MEKLSINTLKKLNLIRLREKRGWLQQDLADLYGCSQVFISKMEDLKESKRSSNIGKYALQKLTKIFECDEDEFIKPIPNTPSNSSDNGMAAPTEKAWELIEYLQERLEETTKELRIKVDKIEILHQKINALNEIRSSEKDQAYSRGFTDGRASALSGVKPSKAVLKKKTA